MKWATFSFSPNYRHAVHAHSLGLGKAAAMTRDSVGVSQRDEWQTPRP